MGAGDDVTDEPDIDEVAVERVVSGDRTITLTRAETTAAVRECRRRGYSLTETADLLGMSRRTVIRVSAGGTPHSRRGIVGAA